MRWTVALLVIASTFAMPVQAQSLPSYTFSGSGLSVDLLDDAGEQIVFEVDAQHHFPFVPHSMTVRMDCTCGELSRSMANVDGSIWRGVLPVSDKDLVVGSWTPSLQASSQSGQTASRTGTAAITVAAAGDTQAPRLSVADVDDGKLELGAGENLQVTVQDDLLRDVRYQIEGMPQAFPLPFPYRLSVSSFTPGFHDVEITAEDRVGRSTSLTVEVFADDAPPSVTGTLPDVLYHGVPNKIPLQVSDDSDVTLVVEVGNASQTFTADAGSRTVDAEITPPELGGHALVVRAVDALGNEVSLSHGVQVEQVVTDVVLLDVEQVSQPIGGEPLQLHIQARQQVGVTDLAFTLAFDGFAVGQVTVPAEGTLDQEIALQVPPGRRSATLRLVAPENVVELAPNNQSLPVTLEVFLARVTHGAAPYHIRGDAQGLPSVAVDEDGGTHALALRMVEGRTVYAFEADGNDLYWDPATSVTDVPLQEEVDVDDRGIPGLGALLLLVMLAAIAMLRRR